MYGMTDNHSGAVFARIGFELWTQPERWSFSPQEHAACALGMSTAATRENNPGDPFAIYNPATGRFE